MSKKQHTQYKFADGTKARSVTSIINDNLGWDKNVLMGWCRKLALQGIDPYKQRDEAAGIGTLTHRYIQCYIYGAKDDKELEELKADAQLEHITIAERALNEYKLWEEANKLIHVESELEFVDEEFRYAGTMDLIATVDGVLGLGDYKTSKLVTPEHIIQMAAYWHAIKNKFDIKWWKLFHIKKELTGDADKIINPKDITLEQIEIGWEVFKRLNEIDQMRNRLEIK